MQSRRDECRPEYGGVQCIMHRYRKTCWISQGAWLNENVVYLPRILTIKFGPILSNAKYWCLVSFYSFLSFLFSLWCCVGKIVPMMRLISIEWLWDGRLFWKCSTGKINSDLSYLPTLYFWRGREGISISGVGDGRLQVYMFYFLKTTWSKYGNMLTLLKSGLYVTWIAIISLLGLFCPCGYFIIRSFKKERKIRWDVHMLTTCLAPGIHGNQTGNNH